MRDGDRIKAKIHVINLDVQDRRFRMRHSFRLQSYRAAVRGLAARPNSGREAPCPICPRGSARAVHFDLLNFAFLFDLEFLLARVPMSRSSALGKAGK